MASRRGEQREDSRLRVLRLLAEDPELSTRQIAEAVGISHGSAYYILSALIKKGFVKLGKWQYTYFLIPISIREKSRLTHSCVERAPEEF